MRIKEFKGFKHQKNFNPSYLGKHVAYRIEDSKQKIVSGIQLSTLKEDKITDSKTFGCLEEQGTGDLYEDPRLFLHNGKAWMSFIRAVYKDGVHWACQGIISVNGLGQWMAPTSAFFPNWGRNHNDVCKGNGILSREKNWTFFSYNQKIHVLYSINPLRVGVMNEDTGEITDISNTMFDSQWGYGIIHGSAGLIPFDGGLLGVFHSFNDGGDGQRKYHVGFYVVDPTSWTVTAISKVPFMSAERDESKDLRPLGQPYRPNVIFPCGLTEENGELLMSYGWQDCRAMLAYISKDEVRSSLMPVTKHYENRMMIRDTSVGIPGGYKCTINSVVLYGAHYNQLMTEAKRNRFTEAQVHDAITPRLPDHLKEMKWHPLKK